jgi:hypothetical protein
MYNFDLFYIYRHDIAEKLLILALNNNHSLTLLHILSQIL